MALLETESPDDKRRMIMSREVGRGGGWFKETKRKVIDTVSKFKEVRRLVFWILFLIKTKCLKSVNTVIEIGAGKSPRIQFALLLVFFRKNYVSVDLSSSKIVKLPFPFKRRFIKSDFFTLEERADLIIFDHSIDDILVNMLSNGEGRKDCAEIMENVKRFDYADEGFLEYIRKILVMAKKLLAPEGKIAISNYPTRHDKRRGTLGIMERLLPNVDNEANKTGFEIEFRSKRFLLLRVAQADPDIANPWGPSVISESEREKVADSLKMAINILDQCQANYRIAGSVLLAAWANRIYRKIADIDIIIDEEFLERVLHLLKEERFQITIKSLLEWQVIRATKDGYLPLDFSLIGRPQKDYYSRMFLKVFELRVPMELIKPIQYNFGKLHFTGTPLSFVIEGMKRTRFKPKRKKDFQVIDRVAKESEKDSTEKIGIYLFGVKIPFLFELYELLYDLVGGLKVFFGKRYEYH